MLFFSMHFYFHSCIFGKKKQQQTKTTNKTNKKNPVLFQCPLPTNIPLNRAHVFLLIQTGSGDEDKML